MNCPRPGAASTAKAACLLQWCGETSSIVPTPDPQAHHVEFNGEHGERTRAPAHKKSHGAQRDRWQSAGGIFSGRLHADHLVGRGWKLFVSE